MSSFHTRCFNIFIGTTRTHLQNSFKSNYKKQKLHQSIMYRTQMDLNLIQTVKQLTRKSFMNVSIKFTHLRSHSRDWISAVKTWNYHYVLSQFTTNSIFRILHTKEQKEIVLIIKQLPGKRTNKKKTESLASSDATSCCCFFRLKWEVDVSPLELESVIFPNN